MNKIKHTPGPWLRDDRSGLECDVRAASGRKVALCWGLASNNASNYHPKYRAECDANAHLIAAAPELLEFVKEWLERQGADDNYMTAKARALIAKATGEQQ